jgi:hypothetical protein
MARGVARVCVGNLEARARAWLCSRAAAAAPPAPAPSDDAAAPIACATAARLRAAPAFMLPPPRSRAGRRLRCASGEGVSISRAAPQAPARRNLDQTAAEPSAAREAHGSRSLLPFWYCLRAALIARRGAAPRAHITAAAAAALVSALGERRTLSVKCDSAPARPLGSERQQDGLRWPVPAAAGLPRSHASPQPRVLPGSKSLPSSVPVTVRPLVSRRAESSGGALLRGVADGAISRLAREMVRGHVSRERGKTATHAAGPWVPALGSLGTRALLEHSAAYLRAAPLRCAFLARPSCGR